MGVSIKGRGKGCKGEIKGTSLSFAREGQGLQGRDQRQGQGSQGRVDKGGRGPPTAPVQHESPLDVLGERDEGRAHGDERRVHPAPEQAAERGGS